MSVTIVAPLTLNTPSSDVYRSRQCLLTSTHLQNLFTHQKSTICKPSSASQSPINLTIQMQILGMELTVTAASPHNALSTFSTSGKTTFPGLILNITSASPSPNPLPQSKPAPSTSFTSALPHPSSCPFLLPYSWPDTFYEFVEMILTSPTEGEHQGFHVVALSLPGFCFASAPPLKIA